MTQKDRFEKYGQSDVPAPSLILASQSTARIAMLKAAGLEFDTQAALIDEQAIAAGLIADQMPARDIADSLAEAKARKISMLYGSQMVLGSDQILETQTGDIFGKPENPDMAIAQLRNLSGTTHKLHSAAVIASGGNALWRHIESVKIQIRPLSEAFIADYVAQYWDEIRYCAGCYRAEAEGVQLFARIEGSHYAILGLPLLPLLAYLRDTGLMHS